MVVVSSHAREIRAWEDRSAALDRFVTTMMKTMVVVVAMMVMMVVVMQMVVI